MVNKKYPNINALWGSLIAEELVRCGVTYFCIAPGSRSSPLTAAIATNQGAKTFVHFDERGLAFHALGFVSATGKPAALVCTSGTAVANFLPAVIEASKKKLPLIVLTADRPPELQKSGTDQTIEQAGIFGKFVKWQFDIPCPSEEIKPEFVLTTMDQAVFQSQSQTPGAVHLNCMFREPLAPVGEDKDFSKYCRGIDAWIAKSLPYTTYVKPKTTIDSISPEILKALKEINNGLIVVGKLSSLEAQEQALRLAAKLGWPVFPDITSGLRLGAAKESNVIAHYAQVLSSDKLVSNLKIDGVLHLGGRMTSKHYYQFIENQKPTHYISVLAHPLRNDPLHAVTLRVQSPVADFCKHIIGKIEPRKPGAQLIRLKKLNEIARTNIKEFIDTSTQLSEIAVARLISRYIGKGSGLFLASSMPIRDMDMFATSLGNSVIIGSNRGASGIDGTIATAVGFAKGLNKPVTLVIGDLAALHDLNSLAMLGSLKTSFTVIIINNNGGGIFNFLPVAKRKDIFEKYFSTPHNLSFESVAKMFGVKYALATLDNFVNIYKNVQNTKEISIIEVKTDRDTNYLDHEKLKLGERE